MNGLGYTLDMGWVDRLVNLPGGAARLEVYDSAGSFWHTLLGAMAGFLPGIWPAVAVAGFAGYELSKVEGGKGFSHVGGALMEFAVGLALAGVAKGVL